MAHYSSESYFEGRILQVYKYEMRVFSIKQVKFGTMIKVLYSKYAPSFVTHFSHHSCNLWIPRQWKSSPFAANHSLSHFFTSSYELKRCSASVWHRCEQVVIGTSQVQWVSSKGWTELPRRVFPMCREPFVMEHFHEKQSLCVASFSILAVFQARNSSYRSIVVANV